MSGLALLARLPALSARLPRRPLGTIPSPLEPLVKLGSELPVGEFWVKREDRVLSGFAGNKIRSLELLLAGKTAAVLSFGPGGSNWARALLRAGHETGHDVDLVLWRSFVNPAGEAAFAADRNRARHLSEGGSLRSALATVRGLLRRPRPRWLWPGGASVEGVLANANAALEACAQFGARERPPPDRVYVPWGSGTTSAGLALGFALAGAHTEVVAVRVTSPAMANRAVLRTLLRRATRWLQRAGVPVPAPWFRLEGRFLGSGYGRPGDPDTEARRRFAETEDLSPDATYGAKAAAALLADARAGHLAGRSACLWLTIQGAPTCGS